MLGALLRTRRRTLGLSAAAVATGIGRPRSWLAEIEAGRARIRDAKSAQGLAEFLGLDPVQIWAQAMAEGNRLSSTQMAPWLELGESDLAGRASGETQPMRAQPRSYKAIEAIAEAIAEQFYPAEVATGRQIPVTHFLLFVGGVPSGTLGVKSPIQVADIYATDERAEGYTRSADGRIAIGIRDDVLDRACAGHGRARFTVAHELGHAFLHQQELASSHQKVFRDDFCTPANQVGGLRPFENAEWQASTWASCFLLPERGVREYLRFRARAEDSATTTEEIADNFGVSVTAMRIRLEKLLPRFAAAR